MSTRGLSGAKAFTRLVVGIIIVTMTAGGCGARHNKSAWRDYEREISPAVGEATPDEFIKKWGPPTEKSRLADGTLYQWKIHKGARSVGFNYFVGASESHRMYDDIKLTFDTNNRLSDWNVDCMR